MRWLGLDQDPSARGGTQVYFPPGADEPVRFWLRLPFSWEEGKAYPLLVFLPSHGGNHRWPWSSPALKTLRQKLLRAGFICVSPDLGPNHWMNAPARAKLAGLLDFLLIRWPIDGQRVHLFGLSMGGSGSLIFAAHYPERVRKVGSAMGVTDFTRFYAEGHYQASLCQAFGGSPDEVADIYRAQSVLWNIDRLAGVPVLILHGTGDAIVPLWNARDFVARMRAAGQEVTYFEIEGRGHGPGIVEGYEEEIVNFFRC